MWIGGLTGLLVALAVSVPLPWLALRVARQRAWCAWRRILALVAATAASFGLWMGLYLWTTPDSPPSQHAQLAVGPALTGLLLAFTHVVVLVVLLVRSRRPA